MALLEVRNLDKRFGGLAAINDLDLDVDEGEIRGIIGPNGAGKTTLFNLISGVFRPTRGRITCRGKEISNLDPHKIAEMGLVRTFQRATLFGEFTVLKNIMLACHLHAREGLFSTLFGRVHHKEKEAEERSLELMEFMGLTGLKDEQAWSLPCGHQVALGITVALAVKPKLLMLDEPVAGMTPTEKQHMKGLIRKVRDQGITVLLVDHDMKVVMDICDKITVLNFGKKLTEGLPTEISQNKDVIEAYLGGEGSAA